jgi:predicted nucleic acid-binding protein
MRFLLDTCVISELVARQPDPGVVRWIDSVDEDDFAHCGVAVLNPWSL